MTHRPVATVGRPTAGGAPLGPGGGVGPGRAGPGAVQPWVYVLAPDRLLDRLGADTPLAQLDLDLAGYRPGTPPPPVGSGRARPRPGHPHARAARLPRRRQPGAGEDSVVAAVRDRRPRRRGPRPQHRRSGPWLSGAPWSSARAAGPRSSAGRPRPPGCCPDTCTAGGTAQCSSPTSSPHPPANQPWPTSTPPPAGPGCPTGEPG